MTHCPTRPPKSPAQKVENRYKRLLEKATLTDGNPQALAALVEREFIRRMADDYCITYIRVQDAVKQRKALDEIHGKLTMMDAAPAEQLETEIPSPVLEGSGEELVR